jgi:hypothetical protein
MPRPQGGSAGASDRRAERRQPGPTAPHAPGLRRFLRSQVPSPGSLRKTPQDSPQAGLNLGRAAADHGPPTPDQESRSLVSWLPPSRRFSKRQTRRKSGTQSHRAFGPVPAGPWQPGSRNEATARSSPVHARLPDLAAVARDARSASPDRRVRQWHRRPSSASSTPVDYRDWGRERGNAAGARTSEPDRSRRSQPATSWRVIELPFPQSFVPLEP